MTKAVGNDPRQFLASLKAKTKVISLEELNKINSSIKALNCKQFFSFGQATRRFRDSVFRAGAAMVAVGVIASAAVLAPNYIPGPGIFAGTQPDVVASASIDIQSNLNIIDSLNNSPPPILSNVKAKTSVEATPANFQIPEFNIQSLIPSERFIDYLRDKEGLRLKAYQDDGGVWTIGYGHTGRMPDGSRVSAGKTISKAQADALLRLDVATHAQAVRDLIGSQPVSLSQFESLCDFSFNKGINRFTGSGLYQAFQEGDYLKAADEYLRWIYVTKKDSNGNSIRDANGKVIAQVLPGLEIRARNNYNMMRGGFSDSALDLMDLDREKDKIENRALRVSEQRMSKFRFSPIPAKNVKQLETTLSRLDNHLKTLDGRIVRQDNLIKKLHDERVKLVADLKVHPAMVNPHVDDKQATSAMDLVGKIAVLEKVHKIQIAERDKASWQKNHYANQMTIVTNTAEAIKQALAIKAQKPGSLDLDNVGRTSQYLAQVAESWRELSAPGAINDGPENVKHLLRKTDTQALIKQLTWLTDGLDKLVDQSTDAQLAAQEQQASQSRHARLVAR